MSIRRFIPSKLTICAAIMSCAILSGCAHIPNQWVEDGPAVKQTWETPTSLDILKKCDAPAIHHRSGETVYLSAVRGVVDHGPLYMEDPFADKGHGRTGLNVYHIGWEDYVALPYCISRYTLNWLLAPVSMIVTPPWTAMESDGEISKQLLGYDHDAERVPCEHAKTEPVTPAESKPADAAPATQPQS